MTYDIAYVIYAMQRTGQHGIINWIAGQADGPTTHINFGKFENGKVIPSLGHPVVQGDEPGERKFFVTNLEDCDMRHIRPERLTDFSPLGDSEKIIEVFIVRDTRNWLASVIRGAKRKVDYCEDDVFFPKLEAHKTHVDEYRGVTNYIEDKVVIVYDWWFQSHDYREEIAKKLDLSFSDKGLNKVSAYGKGSSFDDRKFQERAQEMDVLNRGREMQNDIDFKRYLSMIDGSILDLREVLNDKTQ